MLLFYNGVKYKVVLLNLFICIVNNLATICKYEDYNTIISNNEALTEMGFISLPNKTVNCPNGKDFCFTAWKNNSIGEITIMKQGCWTDPTGSNCLNSDCISETYPRTKINSLFCCCKGSFCNLNFKQIFVYDNLTTLPTVSQNNIENHTLSKSKIIYISTGTFIIFIIISLLLFCLLKWIYVKYHNEIKKDIRYNTVNDHSYSKLKSSKDFSNLELVEILDRGRYGTIWKGKFLNVKKVGQPLHATYVDDDECLDQSSITSNSGRLPIDEVVVKVFKSPYRSYYFNERDVYELPFMKHSNLLEYLGYRELKIPGHMSEYWIVLSYVPDGCLQNYIKANTIDITQFLNILKGIIKGLSHLQKLIVADGKTKPPIAHRDLNTRNILITRNGNHCMICDLGFAYPIFSNHSCKVITKDETSLNSRSHKTVVATKPTATKNGEKTLADVGTIRYMAPEVLEGSINLRDCEAALKQVDIYALALIMWEVGVRCKTFYENPNDTMDYELPFQKEVGLHPSFEDMQILVARNKCRPTFPVLWKTDQAIKLFKETLEHCWDQDAEARLSAFCVEERINEMLALLDIKDSEESVIDPNQLVVSYSDGSQTKNTFNTSIRNAFEEDHRDLSGVSNNLLSNTTVETYLLQSSR